MAVFYILLIWKDRSYLLKLTKIGWAFLFFAIAFSISTATSVLPYASMWGSLERMGGLFTFWHYFIFFVILTSVFRTEEDWLKLFNLTLFVGVLSAFYGFGQRTDIEFFVGSGGRPRIFGTIGNPALFAGYQILNLFLALTLFFRAGNSINWKIFYAFAVVITTIAVLMTAVRGSIMGIGVAFLAFALLYSAAFKSHKAKKYFLYLVALLILFVMGALLFRNTEFVKKSGYLTRLSDFSLTTYTVQTRFWAWEAGFKGWKETPKTILLGWGPENFNIPFSKHFNPKFYRGPGAETLFDRAHNMFVEILVTMGLFGFLTYIWIFGASLKVLWKKIHNKETVLYGVGFIPLLMAYAIHNAFIFDTSANFIVFFTILGFISHLAIPKTADEKKPVHPALMHKGGVHPALTHKGGVKHRKINNALWSFSAVALCVLVIVGIYFINIRPSRANYTTTRAIVRSWEGDFAGAVKKYQEALSYDVPGKYEIRHRFAQYILEKTNNAKIEPETTEVIKLAIEEVQKNIDENTVDYLPYLYVSRLYIILGKNDPASEANDKALEFSMKALELSPTFVRTYYEIGQAYLNKKDLDKASEYFKKAAQLNPEVGLSHWYYGIIEIERGNVELGLSVVEGIIRSGKYTPSESDLGRLVSFYLKVNDYEKLAWVYEILVQNNPANPQHHASLSVALARIGRIDDAVKHAKEAARLNKEFEAEARSFVQSLGREW